MMSVLGGGFSVGCGGREGSRWPRTHLVSLRAPASYAVSEGQAQGVTSVCCGLLRSDSHGCGKGYKPKCKEFLLDLKSENTQAGVWL